MKTCSKCNLELHLEQFCKTKKSKDGHKSQCKACEKKYREENKENISERQKKYRQENKEEIKEYQKKYTKEKKEELSEYNKKYREENKEKAKNYRKEHEEDKRAYDKKYYQENKEKICEYQKKHREERKEEINEYFKNRRKMDEGYRILCCLRARLRYALQGNSKSASTMELAGCSMEFLIDYLEKTKVEGKDYSVGEIDHIRPCASFDLTDPVQQRECFHYTNLQLLTKEDNRKKGAKW